jgi:hypothetical protein
MRSSRYVRPDVPAGRLALQPRDRDLLQAVYVHRYARADHLHPLVFPGATLRVCQRRLRKLWEHRLLDRAYAPWALGGERRPLRGLGTPAYALSDLGAQVVAEELGLPPAEVPHGLGAPGSALVTLEHDLVVTDCLVALEVACRGCGDISLVSAEAEWALWRSVRAWRAARAGPAPEIVVPDGAFTLALPERNETRTFHLEVVRADARGGNRRLLDKLARYVELHRQGVLREAFGHDRLRAVIVATTSEARAERFRALARSLPHGRRLFWFGEYRPTPPAFTPDDVLAERWKTTDGQTLSLLGRTDVPPRQLPASAAS